ncbi:unnamed protein product [Prorocentrum cordatum]|uniref:Protein-L-isoaspartate O-methyltransferase n=1 Tax=Prorocentrum cordatum TaxID=2364126 RepID=A0ABN9X7S0_9DINO|nr:unnamed protein product [Polarella glacialis]
MAHSPLHDMLLAGGEEAGTNAAMVQELERSGVLTTPACSAAFRAVDRRHFWVEGGRLAYTDAPLRHGRLHQSAPHIYARALEALMPLAPGQSFLNVGSGTGYFSSVVHELTGDASINDGIELWPEPIAHARERCRMIGKRSIEFTQGSAYQLDPNMSMRYDRALPDELAALLALAAGSGERPARPEAPRAGTRWRRGLAGALRGGRTACAGALRTTGRCFVAFPSRCGLRRGCCAAVQGVRQLRDLLARCVAAVCG